MNLPSEASRDSKNPHITPTSTYSWVASESGQKPFLSDPHATMGVLASIYPQVHGLLANRANGRHVGNSSHVLNDRML